MEEAPWVVGQFERAFCPDAILPLEDLLTNPDCQQNDTDDEHGDGQVVFAQVPIFILPSPHSPVSIAEGKGIHASLYSALPKRTASSLS